MRANTYNYTPKITTCPKCGGEGFLPFNNEEEFQNFADTQDCDCWESRHLYETYLKKGEVDCPLCGGRGELEEWL